MIFFLGTHHPDWLEKAPIPLFVSRRRLYKMKRLPRAIVPWALDSGAFTEISTFGEWRISIVDYVLEVKRYEDEIGNLQWAAIQDWMCEPFILAKTGLDIRTHQWFTLMNYIGLREAAPEINWLPVLQGWVRDDYIRHLEMYESRGVPIVSTFGVGSICRRQGTKEIADLLCELHGLGPILHGFGVKKLGLIQSSKYLESCDSMAWSFEARKLQRKVCPTDANHINCANCMWYAFDWSRRLLEVV